MLRLNTTALITGATGGIGLELCRVFASMGHNLVITARDRYKLDRLARALADRYSVQVLTIAADLTDPKAPGLIYNQVGLSGARVDILVNNAGFAQSGRFSRTDPRVIDDMLRVNICAATRLSRIFLPEMTERGSGRILNIASTGSFVPGPMNAVYCATKSYILSLSEALAAEAKGTGVKVCAVCPGATHTNFAHRSDMETTPLFNYGVMDPAEVAKTAYRAMCLGRAVTVVGPQNKAMIFATRLAPRFVATKVSGYMQRPLTVKSSANRLRG